MNASHETDPPGEMLKINGMLLLRPLELHESHGFSIVTHWLLPYETSLLGHFSNVQLSHLSHSVQKTASKRCRRINQQNASR